MSDSYELENNAIDGEDEIGSFNHSLAQLRIGHLLDLDDRFTVLTELSLNVSQHDLSKHKIGAKDELKPDVCVYLECPIIPDDDLLVVSKMPDLVIEILSPRQSINYLIRKIKAFFALGVKSCWLVIPGNKSITVYSQPNQYKTFDAQRDTELVDEVMDIRLPIQKAFRK
ncbi:MAG: Uma2 family endonuclease [Pseudomonadota bacterium]